jgi:RNA polymerase sigma-70 factor (ECF subfamily)
MIVKTEVSSSRPPEEATIQLGAPTRWSMVWQAGHGNETSKLQAMQVICQDYWPPVYAYIRRQGRSEQDAEDLTQEFFFRIIRRDWFARADPARGRLRNYLFTSLVNFLRDAHRSEQAEKRGHGQALISLPDAEGSYHREAVDQMSPDRLFQRRWAMHLVEKAVATTGAEYAGRGQLTIFEALQARLMEPDGGGGQLGNIAAHTGMTPGAVRAALFRLRQRFRELLFLEVGHTIGSMNREEIRSEMIALLDYL